MPPPSALAIGLTICAATVFGCNDTAVVVRVESDRGPSELDAICLQLDAAGSSRFGRRYQLATRPLPQTLTALAGGRTSFQAIVYGLKNGIEVARTRRQLAFKDGAVELVSLPLDTCVPAPSSGTFRLAGNVPGAIDRALLEPAASGGLALALGAGQALRDAAWARDLGCDARSQAQSCE